MKLDLVYFKDNKIPEISKPVIKFDEEFMQIVNV